MSLSPVREKKLIWALAAIQFTHILDFMIVMPLGPQLLDVFDISAGKFGVLVSAYSASAAVATLIAAVFLDRFDRQTAIRWSYGLFALATLACALSPNFNTLLLARCCAGFFGGLISVLVQTIVADVVPFERRGKAMGTIMASFSLATVAGVPLSLLAANQFGWQAPFVILALCSAVALQLCWKIFPSLSGHIDDTGPPVFKSLFEVLAVPRYWLAYAFSLSMIFTGFTVIPFITLYIQGNLGMLQSQIPIFYMVGGIATLITAPLIGKASDIKGKAPVFILLAAFLIVPLIAVTHVDYAGFWMILTLTTAFFVFSSGRMIPAMALVGSIPSGRHRGTYMSLNNTVQSAGMASAAFAGGVLAGSMDGRLLHYEYNGWLGAASSLLSIFLLVQLLRNHPEPMRQG